MCIFWNTVKRGDHYTIWMSVKLKLHRTDRNDSSVLYVYVINSSEDACIDQIFDTFLSICLFLVDMGCYWDWIVQQCCFVGFIWLEFKHSVIGRPVMFHRCIDVAVSTFSMFNYTFLSYWIITVLFAHMWPFWDLQSNDEVRNEKPFLLKRKKKDT